MGTVATALNRPATSPVRIGTKSGGHADEQNSSKIDARNASGAQPTSSQDRANDNKPSKEFPFPLASIANDPTRSVPDATR